MHKSIKLSFYSKSGHGENTADILLSLKNVVVHPNPSSPESPASPQGSHSSSPHHHQPSYHDQPHPSHHQWGGQDDSVGHHYSYNYNMASGDGFGCWTAPGSSFSPRPEAGPGHQLPTMSVNVSMNMTMHGVGVPSHGYDHISDQWTHGNFQTNNL